MDLATDPRRPFVYGPTAKAFWGCRDQESILVGPAGTGKSRTAMEYLHQAAQKYHGMRAVMVRRTRKSMTESTLVTWESQVVPAGHACLSGPSRRMRQSYVYPDGGSTIVIQGMDEPIMGGEYDLVYFDEATEIVEDAWEQWITRLRHGRMPYARALGTCNPGPPSHWIRKRKKAGRLTLIKSRHEDNPRMWDAKAKTWTPYGRSYLDKLEALTGARKARLLLGKWSQAEGTVYQDLWDESVHVVPRRELPRHWRRIWSCDFGFTNPFVLQCWAIDDDGRLWLEWEIYRTRRIVEDHARDLKRFLNVNTERPIPVERRPWALVCDHDAEDRATLERHLGFETLPALKAISVGLQEVSSRLKVQPDGKPRMFLLRDAVIYRDPELAQAKKPQSTEEEFDSYVWDTGSGRRPKETPLKEHDHGMDAMRYAVMQLGAPPPPKPDAGSAYDDYATEDDAVAAWEQAVRDI